MNDTRQLQRLIDGAKSLDGREFVIDGPIQIRSGARVRGPVVIKAQRNHPWKMHANDRMGLLNLNSVGDVLIERVTIIGGTDQLHDDTPCPIYMGPGCHRITVRRCVVRDSVKEGIWGTVHDGLFEENYLENIGICRPEDRWHLLPGMQPFGEDIRIRRNRIRNCGTGIGCVGRGMLIEENDIAGCLWDSIGTGDSPRLPGGPLLVRRNRINVVCNGQNRQRAINLGGAMVANGKRQTLEDNDIFLDDRREDPKQGHRAWGLCASHANSDAVLQRNVVHWTGDAVGILCNGDGSDPRVETDNNELRSLSGRGTGMMFTPTKGDSVRVEVKGDSVQGLTEKAFAADFREFRGGTVHATVEDLDVESGRILGLQ